MRRLWAGLTFSALLGALTVAVLWFFSAAPAGRWEPATSSLGLIAAVTGIYAERYTAAMERRQEATKAVIAECERNATTFTDERFDRDRKGRGRPKVYPRFSSSATDRVLTAAVFSPKTDPALIRALSEWSTVCQELNHRLDLTELMIFSSPSAERVESFDRAFHRAAGPFEYAHEVLRRLQDEISARGAKQGPRPDEPAD